jgi:diphthamide biosynthesis protein 2
MENIFSSDALKTIEKEIAVEIGYAPKIKDLNAYFECEHVAEWIQSNGYERVALQFPDELLAYSTNIALNLQTECKNSLVFVLGDTSYGR